ncbi:Transketolase 2 [Clostridium sp. N3C]|uniref:transketolase n=1 Tax=Clostridium sp. N3C TaxID=1776758 RepID=UPI00092DF2A0|nr:transketolase [Clostridium sp. N3C]SCN25754.1 Transketolase 2 [Clostridium sp. N3C]
MNVEFLKQKASSLRYKVLDMIEAAGSGHPGGSFSEIEILTYLYYEKMRLYENPNDPRRDRFILSKGYANPPLYAILADKGYIAEEELLTLRKFGSKLQGHPDMNKCPGIDCSTGSLGQGFSVAVGMALGFARQNLDNHVYVITGDGELQEGIVWEAAMAASHFKLDNLTMIVDYNGLQLDGSTEDVMSLGNLSEKMKAFGFAVEEIDGHCFEDIQRALDIKVKGKPLCIIAKTVKGKGVSYMENNFAWHGNVPQGDLMAQAKADLGGLL